MRIEGATLQQEQHRSDDNKRANPPVGARDAKALRDYIIPLGYAKGVFVKTRPLFTELIPFAVVVRRRAKATRIITLAARATSFIFRYARRQ